MLRILRRSTHPGCTLKYLEWLRLGPTLFPRARYFVLGDDDIYLSFGHLEVDLALQPMCPALQPHVPMLSVQADLRAVAAITREDELVLYGLCAAHGRAFLTCARSACAPRVHRVSMPTAQVDRGDKATHFWQKQKLRGTLAAAQLLEAMHQAESSQQRVRTRASE